MKSIVKIEVDAAIGLIGYMIALARDITIAEESVVIAYPQSFVMLDASLHDLLTHQLQE